MSEHEYAVPKDVVSIERPRTIYVKEREPLFEAIQITAYVLENREEWPRWMKDMYERGYGKDLGLFDLEVHTVYTGPALGVWIEGSNVTAIDVGDWLLFNHDNNELRIVEADAMDRLYKVTPETIEAEVGIEYRGWPTERFNA